MLRQHGMCYLETFLETGNIRVYFSGAGNYSAILRPEYQVEIIGIPSNQEEFLFIGFLGALAMSACLGTEDVSGSIDVAENSTALTKPSSVKKKSFCQTEAKKINCHCAMERLSLILLINCNVLLDGGLCSSLVASAGPKA